MSRPVLILIAVIAILIGGMVLLSTSAKERPTAQVEKDVSLANLQ